jgi:glycosyltransferase involved in cell wall biosynthesis
MLFSIIIPTYNEEKDILKTLISISNQSYKSYEVIIVDDSSDNTPKIIKNYKKIQINLIKPVKRLGRCEARNIGIKASNGDVCILLNADVRIPDQFIENIKTHYDNGYESVTVYSEVENMENCFARYVGLHHFRKIKKNVFLKRAKSHKNIWWSEGFSAKKTMIMKTKLFPAGYSSPIVAGEDVVFVDSLRNWGCKGISDNSIIVKHKAPDNLIDYWNVRVGRGFGTPQIRYFINRWNIFNIFLIISVKSMMRLLKFIAIIPMLLYASQLAKLSINKNFYSEVIILSFCWFLEQLAFSFGEFQSLFKLIRKK